MREYKFRVFHNGEMDYSDNWGNLADFFGHYLGIPETYATLMQYTGFKDSQGREVYDGDILKNAHNGTKARIRWVENQFRTGWSVNYTKTKTIIGNIHSTPIENDKIAIR